MMFKGFRVILAVLMLCAASLLYAGTGTSALPFLRIAPSARAVGLGETFVAIADDANASYWNPAGIANIENTQFSFMHMFYWDSSIYEYIALAYPLSDKLKIGGHVIYLNYGAIDKTTETTGGGFGAAIGTFTPFDLAVAGTIAYKLNDAFQFGANVKFAMQSIDTDSISGLAFDGGILYSNPDLLDMLGAKDFIFGAALSNLGSAISGDSLPLTLRGGFSVKFNVQSEKDLLAAVSAYYPFDSGTISENLGVEYSIDNRFCVRLGYKIGYDAAGLTAGLGYKGELPGLFLYQVDYSYAPAGNIGDTHRLSATITLDEHAGGVNKGKKVAPVKKTK
ncbi:MAG: PorV/PorQ family protein [Candidatus Firestonebacteria bacterium]